MDKERTWIRPFCFSINNDGYVRCGTHDHCSGMFFLEELYRMKDAIEKTLMLYEQESITDSFIKDEDEKAMEEEFSRFSGSGRRDKKSPKVDDLYLIIDKTSMLLKIGRSKDAKKRLHQLQTANGNILELLFVLKNRGNIEDEVQEKFASLHANGEWYKYSEEIITEFISLGGKLLTNKTNKEKELKEKSDSLFEECWKAYRRKGSKKKSLEQWKKLTDKEQSSVLSHIKAYVDSREMQYQKDFERYLRDKVFNDVVFAKNGYVAYDPSKGSTNEYNPHTDLTLMWNDYYKCYMYMGFYNGYIPDGYNDEDRPNGASVTLNNARGVVTWNSLTKKWEKQ